MHRISTFCIYWPIVSMFSVFLPHQEGQKKISYLPYYICRFKLTIKLLTWINGWASFVSAMRYLHYPPKHINTDMCHYICLHISHYQWNTVRKIVLESTYEHALNSTRESVQIQWYAHSLNWIKQVGSSKQ